jgi:esterase/lipase
MKFGFVRTWQLLSQLALPKSFRASNEEIYQLKPELERMVPLWKEVKCPVIVIQGKKDELVPKEMQTSQKKCW